MRVSGRMACVKAMGLRLGPMARSMWESGPIIRPMVREFYIIPMEISTRVSGSMTRPMDTAPILTPMGPSMWESGRTTSRMDSECRSGPMVRSTKDSTRMEPKLAKAS